MKISPNFHLQELVPKSIFDTYGAAAIQFIDYRIVTLLEFERNYFNKPITVNNWMDGGDLQERGFRHPVTGTGAQLGQHKFGRAVDRNVSGLTPQEHHAAIIGHADQWLGAGLTTLENIDFTKTWVHGDVRDVSGFKGLVSDSFKFVNGILIVNP